MSAKNQNVPPVTGRSTYSALSADGTIVAFDSLALDLVPGDANASTDVFTSQVGAICGNGVIEGDEQCDDGNVVDGDGCDANCYPTLCAGGVTIDHASISIRSSGTIDEKIKTLTFKGRLPFAVGSPPGFAPQSTGAQVVVEGLGSAFMGQPVVARPVFDLSFRNVPVPPGLAGVGGPGCRSRDGWHARPTSFNYGSTSDAIDLGLCIAGSAGGLRKITLSDRRTTKGYIGFSVTVSRGGRIDLFGGNGSFRGTVVLGASPAAGQSGACGAVTLSPPACKFDQTHDTIRCR